jgi:hypothetical protein
MSQQAISPEESLTSLELRNKMDSLRVTSRDVTVLGVTIAGTHVIVDFPEKEGEGARVRVRGYLLTDIHI